MRICYFGTYSMEEGYPRNRVIIEGLRRNGVDVVECHEDFWRNTEEKLEGVKTVSTGSMLKGIGRLLRAYQSLFCKFREVGAYDAMIVGYAGHIDIFFARVLNIFRRRPVLFDAFLSLYDTAVMDRRIVSSGSLKAKLLWLMDRWSCRMADAILLDTQAHVDYFVREFRLPAEKFHAIPVGSFIKVHEEPHPHLNPLPEGEEISLLVTKDDENTLPFKGRDRVGMGVFSGEHQNEWKDKFNILYFGSYIPLHGVDVILKAAKIIQDKGNGLPSVIPAQAGIQNANRGLDSHFRGNDGYLEGSSDEPLMSPDLQGGMKIEERVIARAQGPKQSLNVAGFGIASHPPDARNDNAEGFSGESKVIFTLIGTGQLLPAMKELALSLGLKNVIFIERFVSEEELVGYIQQADICLGVFGQTEKASRVIPCKVYNCLAMGKPLITMLSPATEGALTHRENAILCKPGDPAALSEAILSFKNDKLLRETIAHNGQEYFEKNFSARAIGRKVMDVIDIAIRR